jgi:hypothetical protein
MVVADGVVIGDEQLGHSAGSVYAACLTTRPAAVNGNGEHIV